MKKMVTIMLSFAAFLVSGQDWEQTYAQALTSATAEHKPIILVFAGSDWCAPCIKLERNIWQSKEFTSYASENYILYKADFPRKKSNKLPVAIADQNKALAARFNPKGYFPLVVILNSQEQILGKAGYEKMNPDQYIGLLNSYVK